MVGLNWITQLPPELKEKFQTVLDKVGDARVLLEELSSELEVLWEEDKITSCLKHQVEDMLTSSESLETELYEELQKNPVCRVDAIKRVEQCDCPNPGDPSEEACPPGCPGRRDKY